MIRSYLCTALLMVAALFLGTPRVAQAAEGYDNCKGYITSLPAVISNSGTWCMKQDLGTSMASGNAITVAAKNVIIDCNDFTLDGEGAGAATNGYGITSSGHENVTIRNCNFRGFFRAVYLIGGGSGHLVEDNRFDGVRFQAMLVQGDNSVIRRNRVTNTGNSQEFPEGSPNAIGAGGSIDILDNVVAGVEATAGFNAGAYGISSEFNLFGSVSNNRVSGLRKDGANTSYGIYLNGSDRMVVRGNDLVGDASAGSIGILCQTSNVSVRDSMIKGFGTGMSGCGNHAGNVVKP